jgi:hypothetical protein
MSTQRAAHRVHFQRGAPRRRDRQTGSWSGQRSEYLLSGQRGSELGAGQSGGLDLSG